MISDLVLGLLRRFGGRCVQAYLGYRITDSMSGCLLGLVLGFRTFCFRVIAANVA